MSDTRFPLVMVTYANSSGYRTAATIPEMLQRQRADTLRAVAALLEVFQLAHTDSTGDTWSMGVQNLAAELWAAAEGQASYVPLPWKEGDPQPPDATEIFREAQE